MIHRYIIPPGEKMMMLSSLIVTCVGTERRNEHDEGDAFHPKHLARVSRSVAAAAGT